MPQRLCVIVMHSIRVQISWNVRSTLGEHRKTFTLEYSSMLRKAQHGVGWDGDGAQLKQAKYD